MLLVPKFTRGDFKEWAAEVASANAEAVTAGMDDVRRREYLTFYGSYGLDYGDLRRLVRTPEGAERVCRTCLSKAKVRDAQTNADKPAKTADEVNAIIEATGTGPLVTLAWVLADLDDAALFKAQAPELKDGDGTDPLTRPAKPDSSG